MTIKQTMGEELKNIEMKLRANGYKVESMHGCSYDYFTAENAEGYQVYCQVGDYCMGYDVSCNYKPSRNEGSGRSLQKAVRIDKLYQTIINAFVDSKKWANRFGMPDSIVNFDFTDDTVSQFDIRHTIKGIKKDIGYREQNILDNLDSIEQNTEVPEGYRIFRFFDKNGNGFEAGKTPNGYSITL